MKLLIMYFSPASSHFISILFLVVALLYVFFVLFYVFLCSFYYLFCDVSCIVCVYMCTEQLPPGGYPIAVKYISYHKSNHSSEHPVL